MKKVIVYCRLTEEKYILYRGDEGKLYRVEKGEYTYTPFYRCVGCEEIGEEEVTQYGSD